MLDSLIVIGGVKKMKYKLMKCWMIGLSILAISSVTKYVTVASESIEIDNIAIRTKHPMLSEIDATALADSCTSTLTNELVVVPQSTTLSKYRIEIQYPDNIEDTYISEEYQNYIYDVCSEYDISPELVMAMIEKESSGIATVSSPNGKCKGLMQIYDRYHQSRMTNLDVTDIYDPESNIRVGVDYLYELIISYGDVATALMVYNGDSRALEEGYISSYANKILNRANELEQLHYGVPVLVENNEE